MSLLVTRNMAMAHLAKVFPELKIRELAGSISLEALTRKQPGPGVTLYVAVLGGFNEPRDSPLDLDLLAAFMVLVVVRKPQAEARENEALGLVDKLCLAIHGQTFDLPISPALVDKLELVSDQALQEAGVTVWAITWQQRIIFGI